MKQRWAMAAVVGAAALAGCSSEDSDPTVAFCTGFGPGATVTFDTCTNCSPVTPSNSGDGNLSTQTSIVPTPGNTTETFVLTATSVNDIAGGTTVGLWVTQPATLTTFSTNIETFLNGSPTPVETLNSNNDVVIVADEGTPAGGYIGMQATQAFDQVRVTRTNNWNSGADPVYRVYEICSDGGAN